MASNTVKGFTLVEAIVATFIFVTALTIIAQIYVLLTRTAVQIQDLQFALDSFRFATEKFWVELKASGGIYFTPTALVFKDRTCRDVKVYQEGDKIIFERSGVKSELFDPSLVEVTAFRVYSDVPQSSGSYVQTSYKVIILNYEVNLKTKSGKIPYSFWQAVAPLNSVLVNPPCP